MSTAATIAVTGWGSLGAAGFGRAALAGALAAGAPRLSEIARVPGLHVSGRGPRVAALVDPGEIARRLPGLDGRRMSPPARYAVIAARAALDDAGLVPSSELDPGVAVVSATAFGPSSFTQRLMDQLLDDGPALVSPALFSECVANAPAARVAIACRAGGANVTIVQGECSPLRAAARGAQEVAEGRARVALAGAVEEMTPLVHGVLDRFRALARPAAGAPERGRPFERERDGYLAGEGATFLVLESPDHALRRGARALALLRGSWSAFDATAPPSGWGTGEEPLARALIAGLERAGLAVGDVDRIVSGASGSVAGDRLEARLLRRAWGGRALPPILAPKSVTGEFGGAFLGAALLAVTGAPFARTGSGEVDPDLGIRVHHGSALGAARRVLVTSLAAGGAASWLVLEQP